MKNSIDRYIKNRDGKKVKMRVTSVNIREDQLKFLEKHDLNLSKLTRDAIDDLMSRKK